MPPMGYHMISYWRGHGILGVYSHFTFALIEGVLERGVGSSLGGVVSLLSAFWALTRPNEWSSEVPKSQCDAENTSLSVFVPRLSFWVLA